MASPKVRRRLWLCGMLVTFLGAGLGLILWAFEDNIAFYVTPTELLQAPLGHVHRLGGLVEGDIVQESPGFYRFTVSDGITRVQAAYHGTPPALFRSSKGVVAIGTWDPAARIFQAKTLLAKHDETYRPPAGKKHVSG